MVGNWDNEQKFIELEETPQCRILVIGWNPTKDLFSFTVKPEPASNLITKRTIVSEIAQVSEPLVLVSPVIIFAKQRIQELWQLNNDWDVSVPLHLDMCWSQLRGQLHCLNQLPIPRGVNYSLNAQDLQLHGYGDASQHAYGACIYSLSKIAPGRYRVQLLCSKSRVALLKAISLPRLELSVALLLSRLLVKVRESFDTLVWVYVCGLIQP